MKLSCFGFALFAGALINDNAFLERKQHIEEIESETISSVSPWALVHLLWSQRRGKCAGGLSRRRGHPGGVLGRWRKATYGLWRGAEDDWSYKQDLQELQIRPRHRHETVGSHFPSSRQSSLMNFDLSHAEFAVISYHHQTDTLFILAFPGPSKLGPGSKLQLHLPLLLMGPAVPPDLRLL